MFICIFGVGSSLHALDPPWGSRRPRLPLLRGLKESVPGHSSSNMSKQAGQANVGRWVGAKERASQSLSNNLPTPWAPTQEPLRDSAWMERRPQPPRMSASGQRMMSAAFWGPVWLWIICICMWVGAHAPGQIWDTCPRWF